MSMMSGLTADSAALTVRSARMVAELAVLYHRHDDPTRALALGLAALRFGDDRPRTALLIASCFLRTGDADQALAALDRLKGRDLTSAERAAAVLLEAKVRHRQGDLARARALLADAVRLSRKVQE